MLDQDKFKKVINELIDRDEIVDALYELFENDKEYELIEQINEITKQDYHTSDECEE